MLVFLDRQHVGQVRRLGSLGAIADVDGDGEKQIHEAEAFWTGYLSLALETNLRELGHDVIPLLMVHTLNDTHELTNTAPTTAKNAFISLFILMQAGAIMGLCFMTTAQDEERI